MKALKTVTIVAAIFGIIGLQVVSADPVPLSTEADIPIQPLPSSLVDPISAKQIDVAPETSALAARVKLARSAVQATQLNPSPLLNPRGVSGGINNANRSFFTKRSEPNTPMLPPKASMSIQKASSVPGDIKVHLRADGTLRWIGMPSGGIRTSLSSTSAMMAPEAAVRDFLSRHQPLLGIKDPLKEFELYSVHVDSLGTQQLRFQQIYDGLPVWGAQLIAQVSQGGELKSVGGAFSPTPRKLVSKPTVDSSDALNLAQDIYDPRGVGLVTSRGLVIVANRTPLPRLAWENEISVSATEKWLVHIDAHTGTVINAFNQIYFENVQGQGVDLFGQTRSLNVWQEGGVHYLIDTSKPMYDATSVPLDVNNTRGAIYIGDFENTETTVSGLFSLNGPNGPWLADGVSAAANVSSTYNYFLEQHGRNSLDNLGSNLFALVRYGQGVNNAFFDGSTLVMGFGDAQPYAGALDVIGHEFTHGVIFSSANLIYQDQSGAVNEALADIFGEMIEARETGSTDWLLGSNLNSPIRNMADPGSLISGLGRPYPSNFSEYEVTTLDNGGVHINSSIINHAFYLLAEGLPDAIGISDASSIFYRMLTTKLTPLSDFFDTRFNAILSAEELFGQGSPQANATSAAFDAVGIYDFPGNPLPAPTPNIDAPDATLFTYWDSVVGAYFLGRMEPGYDPPQGSQLSTSPISGARASVTGNGEIAIFVNDQNDACFIATLTPGPESCVGVPGQIASVAMSADGNTFGLVLLDNQGSPTNRITVIDIATDTAVDYVLQAPVFDGVSSLEVIQADAMDFTADSRFLVYDAFNVADFGANGVLGLWSLYAIDLLTGTTFALIAPTPSFDTAYPSIAQTSDGHMAFDAYDRINNQNIVATADIYAGQSVGLAVTNQNFSIPTYSGDDGAVVFSFEDAATPTGSNLWQIPLAADRINPSGDPQIWLQDAGAGAIYRRGTYQEPERIDLELSLTGRPSSGHIAVFDLELVNNSDVDAIDIVQSLSIPPNIEVVAINGDNPAGCVIDGNQILCTRTGLGAGFARGYEFQFRLISFSPNETLSIGATAFATQTDSDERNNRAFADVPERQLNEAPVLDSALANRTVTENQAANFSVSGNFSDLDNDALDFIANGLPAGLTLNSSSGVVSGTPNSSSVRTQPYPIDITATDPFGESAQGSFEITVNAAPPPPPPPKKKSGGGSMSIPMILFLAMFGLYRERRRGAAA